MDNEEVSADEIEVGDLIDWRGDHALVVAAWQSQEDSPIPRAPVGIEIEVHEDGIGEPGDEVYRAESTHRIRLTWPELPARVVSGYEEIAEEDIESLLKKDLKDRPVLRRR